MSAADRGGDDVPQPYALVYPFVACRSNGGPYDDVAFVAGFQAGRVERALAGIAAAGGDRLTVTVYTALVKQLELIGMDAGFPLLETVDHEGVEWSTVTFTRVPTAGI